MDLTTFLPQKREIQPKELADVITAMFCLLKNEDKKEYIAGSSDVAFAASIACVDILQVFNSNLFIEGDFYDSKFWDKVRLSIHKQFGK